jgi:hypothetical protein
LFWRDELLLQHPRPARHVLVAGVAGGIHVDFGSRGATTNHPTLTVTFAGKEDWGMGFIDWLERVEQRGKRAEERLIASETRRKQIGRNSGGWLLVKLLFLGFLVYVCILLLQKT